MSTLIEKKSLLDKFNQDLEKLNRERLALAEDIKKQEDQQSRHVFKALDDVMQVQYYETNIVEFNDKKIVLNTGGHNTLSTLRHMNEASKHYKLGFEISCTKSIWEIKYKGNILPYDTEVKVLDR